MSYLEIVKKMNRVIASCTDKKQLPMAARYCDLLIGKLQYNGNSDEEYYLEVMWKQEDLSEHRDLMISRRFQ